MSRARLRAKIYTTSTCFIYSWLGSYACYSERIISNLNELLYDIYVYCHSCVSNLEVVVFFLTYSMNFSKGDLKAASCSVFRRGGGYIASLGGSLWGSLGGSL
jgi:hypothetical protein